MAYTQQMKEKTSAYQKINFFGNEELGSGQAKNSWYFPVFRIYS